MSLEYVSKLYVNTKADVDKLLVAESLLRRSTEEMRLLCFQERDRILRNADRLKEMVMASIHSEISALKDIHDRMTKLYVHAEDIITVNVGGVRYASSRATFSKERGSVLQGVVADPPLITSLKDNEGNIFFDRDGDLFQVIINYLRTSQLPPDLTKAETRMLRNEGEFFGLKVFVTLLDSMQQRTVRVKYAVLTYNNNFAPSSFMGMAPDGIELFYFQGDCFKSYKEMTQVLADMRNTGWEVAMNINPGRMNGRLLFCKQEVV